MVSSFCFPRVHCSGTRIIWFGSRTKSWMKKKSGYRIRSGLLKGLYRYQAKWCGLLYDVEKQTRSLLPAMLRSRTFFFRLRLYGTANPPAPDSSIRYLEITLFDLKVPSHLIRSAWKCYGWVGLEEYIGWYTDFFNVVSIFKFIGILVISAVYC